MSTSNAPPAVIVVGETDARLWSLEPAVRQERLARRAGAGAPKAIGQLGPEEPAFLIRADAVVEERLARALIDRPGVILTAKRPT